MNPSGPERRNNDCTGRRFDDGTCFAHTGMESNISHLKDASEKHETLLQRISSRSFIILTGVCVSCILLAVNITLSYVKTLGD